MYKVYCRYQLAIVEGIWGGGGGGNMDVFKSAFVFKKQHFIKSTWSLLNFINKNNNNNKKNIKMHAPNSLALH